MLSDKEFTHCAKCETFWNKRIDFLSDTATEIVAYNPDIKYLEHGNFVFKHDTCGSNIEIQVVNFKDLYDGPIYKERKTGTENCPEYCLNSSELRPCSEECECAYVREIIQALLSIY
ncbi:MAG: hypothetical protein HOC71_07990 [Candidatus Latescibacteria bacterium]|nr:hypothetical protein [Candidatus Latescibacterota bacterium]